MTKVSASSVILAMLGKLVIAEVSILAVAAAISWFGGWRTLWAFSDVVMLVGFAVIGVGVYSLFGARHMASDFRYRFSQTVMDDSIHERTKLNMLDVAQSKSFAIVAGLCGVVAIVLGGVLKSIRF